MLEPLTSSQQNLNALERVLGETDSIVFVSYLLHSVCGKELLISL